MEEITLKVSVNEANMIVNALVKMPFEAVNGLVPKLIEQANAQLPAKDGGN